MSIVQGLAFAHLSATALLLLVFLTVVAAQRVTASWRARSTAVGYPSDGERSGSGAGWQLDDRAEPAAVPHRQLQTSS